MNPQDYRSPGGILLISTYSLGQVPVGLSSPAAFFRAAGFSPRLMDLAAEKLDPLAVASAAWVGIHVHMHTALRLGILAAQKIRSLNPACHISFYGLYATLNASLLLSAEGAGDSVVGGEFEPVLVDWVRALADAPPGVIPPAIPGVLRAGGQAGLRLARTDFLPPSRLGLQPLERYAHLQTPSGSRVVGYVEATRGCKHHCRHCPIPPVYGGRFFAVPRSVVMEDIAALVSEGAQHITFGDPDFLNGPAHALSLVRELHRAFPSLTYDFTSKVEHLLKHQQWLPEFAATGCLFVVTAVESLEAPVLETLHKGHTRAEVEAALRLVRQAGIAPRPTFVPFTPWSTLPGYLELLEFLAEEGLVNHVDPVQLSIRLLVPPGSLLETDPNFLPHRGDLDAAALVWRWRHPDPRMDALHAAVNARVAAGEKDSAEVLFSSIYQLARNALGHDEEALSWASLPPQPVAPRLSEPWFC